MFGLFKKVTVQLEEWYDYWYEHIKETGELKSSLCHGALQPAHVLYKDNRCAFINWETLFIGHPARDITQFLRSVFIFHDAPYEDIKAGVMSYRHKFQFSKSDMALICLHLLKSEQFIKRLTTYTKHSHSLSEAKWVQIFQRYQFYFDLALKLQEEIKQDIIFDLDEDEH
nr:phosphotransferase [Salirhabdus salicampi]